MPDPSAHKFPEIAARLKRAQGHLAGVIAMVESGRPCMELAQQLHAVEKPSATPRKRSSRITFTTAWKKPPKRCRASLGT